MISAVDTNILLDIARPNPLHVDDAVELLNRTKKEGNLIISTVVHAEVSAHFPNKNLLENFLDALGIEIDALSTEATWVASRSWLSYRTQGGKRERIISDFLIGAHAATQAGRLLTRDRGFYRKYFSDLSVIENPDDL